MSSFLFVSAIRSDLGLTGGRRFLFCVQAICTYWVFLSPGFVIADEVLGTDFRCVSSILYLVCNWRNTVIRQFLNWIRSLWRWFSERSLVTLPGNTCQMIILLVHVRAIIIWGDGICKVPNLRALTGCAKSMAKALNAKQNMKGGNLSW